MNLKQGIDAALNQKNRDTCTACAGTMILEFAALSRLTGDPIYEVGMNMLRMKFSGVHISYLHVNQLFLILMSLINSLPPYIYIYIYIYIYTGHSRYVDFAYLDTTTYVEVIFHSQHFFSIFLCISTPSMSKTVNTKQRVSRGDFHALDIFSIIFASVYVEVLNQRSHGRHIVCFGHVYVLAEVRITIKVN